MLGFSTLRAGLTLAAAACCVAAPGWANRPIVRGSESEIATTYQINSAHTGDIDFAAGFATPLKQAWTRDLTFIIGYNPVVVADGTVFTMAGGYNLALNLANGRDRWMKKAKAAGLLTYDNGGLFSISPDGIVSSISKDTGKAIWAKQLPDQYDFRAPPMAVNGQIFIAGTGVGGDIYAVDEATGNLNWEQPVENGDVASPTFGDNGIYVTYPCRYYKFDSVTGSRIWHVDGNDTGGGGATTVYFNKELLVQDGSFCGNDTVRKSQNGKVLGHFTSQTPWTPAVFVNSKGNYLGANVEEDSTGWTLHCWNIKTGKQLWKYTADGTISTLPIVINGVIYVGSTLGGVFAVNESGQQIWTTQSPGTVYELTAGDGALIVVGRTTITAYVPQ